MNKKVHFFVEFFILLLNACRREKTTYLFSMYIVCQNNPFLVDIFNVLIVLISTGLH